jgi:hypothetical protein
VTRDVAAVSGVETVSPMRFTSIDIGDGQRSTRRPSAPRCRSTSWRARCPG